MSKFDKETIGNNLNLKFSFTDKEGNQLTNEKIDSLAAGILNNSLDYTCIYGPTANSYKRFFEHNIQENWNKIGSLNSVKGINIYNAKNIKETQIEFNLPGSDVNPYLVLTTALNSALNGYKNNFYSKDVEKILEEKKLPINLNEAIELFNDSKDAKLLFGEDFHYHYRAFYEYEYGTYLNQVSSWERNRYLNAI